MHQQRYWAPRPKLDAALKRPSQGAARGCACRTPTSSSRENSPSIFLPRSKTNCTPDDTTVPTHLRTKKGSIDLYCSSDLCLTIVVTCTYFATCPNHSCKTKVGCFTLSSNGTARTDAYHARSTGGSSYTCLTRLRIRSLSRCALSTYVLLCTASFQHRHIVGTISHTRSKARAIQLCLRLEPNCRPHSASLSA